MDFLNKAKASIANASKDISQKASESVELAKVANRIREIDRDYEELLKTLARTALNEHFDEIKALCPEIVENIDKNRADMEAAKAEQAELKNGNGPAAPAAAPAAGGKFCPNCGKTVPEGAKFCAGCGNSIE